MKCTNCNRTLTADPRLKCKSCREPVCIDCVVYDEDGNLLCPECLAESDAGDIDQPGPWW